MGRSTATTACLQAGAFDELLEVRVHVFAGGCGCVCE